jgi:hypothetical protein
VHAERQQREQHSAVAWKAEMGTEC